VKKGLWEERIRKNASTKNLGPCDRIEEGVYAQEGKGVLIIKGRKRGSTSIRGGPTTERVYLALKIAANIASTFRGKKGR